MFLMVERENIKLIVTRIPGIENYRWPRIHKCLVVTCLPGTPNLRRPLLETPSPALTSPPSKWDSTWLPIKISSTVLKLCLQIFLTSYLLIKILQAEFTMYVGRSPDYRSLSNMPLKTVRMCYQAWVHICTVSDNSTALWRPLGEGLVVRRVLPIGEDVLLSGGSRRCLAVQVPWVRARSGRSNH